MHYVPATDYASHLTARVGEHLGLKGSALYSGATVQK